MKKNIQHMTCIGISLLLSSEVYSATQTVECPAAEVDVSVVNIASPWKHKSTRARLNEVSVRDSASTPVLGCIYSIDPLSTESIFRRFPSGYDDCSVNGDRFRCTKPGDRRNVRCPVERVDYNITGLRIPWWSTVNVGTLNRLEVMSSIGGRPALVCVYNGMQVRERGAQRESPPGYENCSISGNRFICTQTNALKSFGSKSIGNTDIPSSGAINSDNTNKGTGSNQKPW